MPITRIPCYFSDEGTATHVTLPRGSFPKVAEALHNDIRHDRKVLLVLDRESKMLKVITRSSLNTFNKKIKAISNPKTSTNRTDRTEPITAVDGSIEIVTAGST